MRDTLKWEDKVFIIVTTCNGVLLLPADCARLTHPVEDLVGKPLTSSPCRRDKARVYCFSVMRVRSLFRGVALPPQRKKKGRNRRFREHRLQAKMTHTLPRLMRVGVKPRREMWTHVACGSKLRVCHSLNVARILLEGRVVFVKLAQQIPTEVGTWRLPTAPWDVKKQDGLKAALVAKPRKNRLKVVESGHATLDRLGMKHTPREALSGILYGIFYAPGHFAGCCTT